MCSEPDNRAYLRYADSLFLTMTITTPRTAGPLIVDVGHKQMKFWTKPLGIVFASIIAGSAMGWLTFRYLYQVEILGYDRSQLDLLQICFGTYPPLLVVSRDGHSEPVFFAQPPRVDAKTLRQLESVELFERLTRLSKDGPYVILDDTATIADLLHAESLGDQWGGSTRFLLAPLTEDIYDLTQMRELRLSPQPNDYSWHMREWALEGHVMEQIRKDVSNKDMERTRETRRRFFLPYWE